MQKDIFIELVYQAAHANRPSTDFVVLRADIEAYIPAVVNFALTKGFYTQKNQEGNGDIPTQFYAKYTDIPVSQETTGKMNYYFEMPALLVALPSDRGLRMITDNCGNLYTPIKDIQLSNIDYWLKVLPCEKFYSKSGNNVTLYNKPSGVVKMNLTGVVESSELKDTDQLPLPAGEEKDAIDMCMDFVLGVRQLPVDRKVDGRNLN